MRRLPAVVTLGLTIMAAPAPALACAIYSPLKPEAVRAGQVVVVGRLSHYRREASAESRRRFEESLRDPRPTFLPPGYKPTPGRDINTFEVAVERVVVGQAPARILVGWPTSNISPPETVEDGLYLIALNPSEPGARHGAPFTAVGHVCSGAFLYPATSRKALAALRVLAGKPPYPPDPPPLPQPEPSDAPRPAPMPAPPPPGPEQDRRSLIDRTPPGARVMLAGAALGLLVGVCTFPWRRRKDGTMEAEQTTDLIEGERSGPKA